MSLEIKGKDDVVPRMTGIIWGPPKCGKTTLLSSAPGKKLWINIDPDGWQSIGSRSDFSLVDVAEEDPAVIARWCKDKLPTLIKDTEDFGPGDTLVFDSVSSYQQAALLTAIEAGVGKSNSFKPSIETPGLAAYGARTQYVVNTIRNVLKATGKKGMHCFFVTHQDLPNTDDKGNFLYQTMLLSDNAINQAGLAVSEIWFMSENDKKRRIAVRPCRGRQPMGSRLFTMTDDPEFDLKYDPTQDDTQPHSISTWWNAWLEGGKQKLPLPK